MRRAIVTAVCVSGSHTFSKSRLERIMLLAGLGVEGDAHAGSTVKHRSRVRQNPDQPNLRQIHLVHEELLEELREQGFHVAPGSIGENVTTRGIELLALPTGTRLHPASIEWNLRNGRGVAHPDRPDRIATDCRGRLGLRCATRGPRTCE